MSRWPFLITLSVSFHVAIVSALDNGLGQTPPMGWLAWERFRCNVDCDNDPKNCVSENLFKEMADHLVSDGFLDAGYNYVNIDDCWMEEERDPDTGRLVPDRKRFPNGIKSLASYMHERGLKLGIYEDYGNMTCQNYPGLYGHEETDIQTFADWGVDSLKLDKCHRPKSPAIVNEGFKNVSRLLNATGRHILYTCEWPAKVTQSNYQMIAKYCNTWRVHSDIQDSWDSVIATIDYTAANQDVFSSVSAPGSFNDLDMLVIGDFSLSPDQSKTQMAMWCILASPLLMSNDLRGISDWAKDILLNKEVIEVNQDSLGAMGKKIIKQVETNTEVWSKPLVNDSQAVAVFSRSTSVPQTVHLTLHQLGLNSSTFYYIRDLFEHKTLGRYSKDDIISVTVNPGGVVMLRASLTSPDYLYLSHFLYVSNQPAILSLCLLFIIVFCLHKIYLEQRYTRLYTRVILQGIPPVWSQKET
ncbi:alpha-N-acetylgalactosaminidase-like isoform X2 [Anneissia japonica]|nr:alpha-N-acetylgalactosaminidase-like isoform X2 [Anneissia japonica]